MHWGGSELKWASAPQSLKLERGEIFPSGWGFKIFASNREVHDFLFMRDRRIDREMDRHISALSSFSNESIALLSYSEEEAAVYRSLYLLSSHRPPHLLSFFVCFPVKKPKCVVNWRLDLTARETTQVSHSSLRKEAEDFNCYSRFYFLWLT